MAESIGQIPGFASDNCGGPHAAEPQTSQHWPWPQFGPYCRSARTLHESRTIRRGSNRVLAADGGAFCLTSEETQKEEREKGGGVPGRKSAAETPGFLAFPPNAALYYQTLPHTNAVPPPANFREVEKIFIRHHTAMKAGEETIADGV